MRATALIAVLTGISTFASVSILPAQEVTRETGSGEKYRTIVTRQGGGELSEEDFRQATLLASNVTMHLNEAVVHLGDESTEKARAQLDKAGKLVGVLRDLLPVTEVTTRVVGRDGEEVYRHVSRVQNDQIPIYTGTIAIEVIEPLLEAKKEHAALAGLRLTDADLVYTSVLVDLDYLERKLRRANMLLGEDKQAAALAELALAQSTGVRLVVNKQDHPLMDAQLALRLAWRMAEDDRIVAARGNLQVAGNQLEIYRNLLTADEQGEVRSIQQDLQALLAEDGESIAAERIRELWQRVSSLFEVDVGEMRPTESDVGAVGATVDRS